MLAWFDRIVRPLLEPSRKRMSIIFFLVAIDFIVFDLEAAFLIDLFYKRIDRSAVGDPPHGSRPRQSKIKPQPDLPC